MNDIKDYVAEYRDIHERAVNQQLAEIWLGNKFNPKVTQRTPAGLSRALVQKKIVLDDGGFCCCE